MNAVIDLETLQVVWEKWGFLAGWEWFVWVVAMVRECSEGMEYLYVLL